MKNTALHAYFLLPLPNAPLCLDGIEQQLQDLDGSKWEYRNCIKTIKLVGAGDLAYIANVLGISGASEIAAMLGLPERDNRWCTPWRDDVSYLCNISNIGGFGSKGWTFHGWILDACSMEALQEEFPEALTIRLEDL